jgi:hypothetical protein
MTPDDIEQLEYADIIVSMWALGERLERMKQTLEDINRQIDELP